MSYVNWEIFGLAPGDDSTKKLLCPICIQPWGSRALPEHLAMAHLPINCLQIARCLNDKCAKKKDIFSPNYLTDHVCDSKYEHKFIVPRKRCKHRIECQKIFDSLMEISIFLGLVDRKCRSIYGGDGQKRIDKFIKEKPPIEKMLKMDCTPHPRKTACFVTEHFDEVKRNGGVGSYDEDEAVYNFDQRSPAYDSRSPGRSPGRFTPNRSPAGSPGPLSNGDRSPGGPGGRSPAYFDRGGRSPAYFDRDGRSPAFGDRGGRSPAYGDRGGRSPAYGDRGGRSPGFFGGRSPGGPGGRSPAYDEPLRRIASFLPRSDSNNHSQERSSRHSSRDLGPSRSSGAAKRPAEILVKKEVMEDAQRSHSSRPSAHYDRPLMNRANSGNAASSTRLPPETTPSAAVPLKRMHYDVSSRENPSIRHDSSSLNSANGLSRPRRSGFDVQNTSSSSRPSFSGPTSSHVPPPMLSQPSQYNPSWINGFPPQTGYSQTSSSNPYSSSYKKQAPQITPQLDKLFPEDDNGDRKRRESSDRHRNDSYGGRR